MRFPVHGEPIHQKNVEAYATKKMNEFMRGIYSNDLFIEKNTAKRLSEGAREFIRAYVFLASRSYEWGKFMFPLYPKLHALHEIVFLMRRQAQHANFAFNCAANSCSMDEDFIGRTAAVCRSVSPRLVPLRTIQRYLCHIKMAWSEDAKDLKNTHKKCGKKRKK